MVDSHRKRYPVLAGIANMPAQVFQTALHRLHIFLGKRRALHATVHFQRPYRGHDYRNVRAQTRLPALDIEKLFRPQICAEACLGYHVIR